MKDKYFELKLLEFDKAEDNPGGCHDDYIAIMKQIAIDQREACAKAIVDALQYSDDIDQVIEAIRNAEIK